jgi:hypothetical protein
MAVAGSVVHAYRCWLEDGKLKMQPTSILRELCDAPDYAVLLIRAGDTATVAGADVDAVRMQVTKEAQK